MLARRRTTALAGIAAIAVTIGLVTYALGVFSEPELQTVDARFALRGTQPAPRDIVVVALDVASLNALNMSPPLPRTTQAKLIDRLRQAGARVIAMDIEFTWRTTDDADRALVDAVYRTPGIVLAATEADAAGQTQVLGTQQVVTSAGARVGNGLLAPDADGVLRRMPCESLKLKSLAVVIAEQASHRHISCATFGGDRPIDYRGGRGTFRTYRYIDVLRGRIPRNALRGTTVIVGNSAPILQDQHATSFSGSKLTSGPEVVANEVASLLDDGSLRFTPAWLGVLLIIAMGAVVPLGALRLRGLWPLALGVGALTAYAVGVYLAFLGGSIVLFVYPALALVTATVGVVAFDALFAAFERDRIRGQFSRFVPETVVDQVLEEAGGQARLGGIERECTVMFCDLRGFTTFSQSLPAPRVIDTVNEYLQGMSEAILAAGGTLVSYMGDGIMALFGAPIDQPDHADRALAAAREMTGPRLAAFNAWMTEQGYDQQFRMGVGLNTGPVMAGNVGSEQRLEYTAIGDTTNTAARLEGMTKGTPHMVMLADSTRALLRTPPDDLVDLGAMPVRGRDEPLHVWGLVEPEDAG